MKINNNHTTTAQALGIQYMNQPLPRFQEEYSAKIPALTLLAGLGWSFLSPKQTLAARDGRSQDVVLRGILRDELRKRRYWFAGQQHALSEQGLDTLINDVCQTSLNEGLLRSNQRQYGFLLDGHTITEFINGKKAAATISLIDWDNIANNRFDFTEEYSVLRQNGIDSRRPDIVCFINGIPIVVIEAKRPDGHQGKAPTVTEGISQHLRNQRPDEIPHLFSYAQLLLSISGVEARYGTTETQAKFWAAWRDEDITEPQFAAQKNRVLDPTVLQHLFTHRPSQDLDWYQQLLAGGERAVTEQDRLIIGLLRPDRLLELIRYFILYDKKVGKIVARYQQVFGIKRLLEQVQQKNTQGQRQGGVIWHTTGTGKSFTMVFLSKALLLTPNLKQCRIIIVTDRIDLEHQLSKTFASGGELSGVKDYKNAMMTTGQQLAKQIGKGTERLTFSLVQKFNTAAKLPECHNPSSELIVLVDEGHRSHGGENHIRMRQALPNAAFVAFTGTPLLKEDKTTNKFGKIVHAYTMQRAVEDQTVTPLLYEERKPDLDINDRALDKWFERITATLSTEQKADLKRKYAQKGQVYQAEDRLRLIALDIATHFTQNIPDGLKGQVACDSKLSAIKYKTLIDEAVALLDPEAQFETAVVISAPDTREGNSSVDESGVPEVTQWWLNNVGNTEESIYTKSVIERFEKDPKLKLLIVVDKLLTGFDEPKNTVLYIDKPLKSHNLIQAIARVNRLHDDKKFGLLIDYRGILAELDITIGQYQDLAKQTQGGFEINDLAGLYQQMSVEYKRLPSLYRILWAIFKSVKNKQDLEQLRQVLIPKLVEQDGELIDQHLKIREDFYEALSEFSSCLHIALQSMSFFEDQSFSDADRQHYKDTVKQLNGLRQLAKRDAGETVDYGQYTQQIKKLLDKHVVGVEVHASLGVYQVGQLGGKQRPQEWSEEKTRNETDIIKTRISKMIEQDLRDDPYAQQTFSSLLRQAIEAAEKLFDHPLKQYLLFESFEDKVQNRQLDELPSRLQGLRYPQAYFGVFKLRLGTLLLATDEAQMIEWVDLALWVDQVVNTVVAENSINPQSIDSELRKALLPTLFQRCKQLGEGMDQAKAIVEGIVQIVRVGTNKPFEA